MFDRLCYAVLCCLAMSVSGWAQPSFTTTKTTPEKALKALKEGQKSMQEGDAAGALRAYRKSVEIDSNFVDGWAYLGGAHRESNHWPEAERAFERVIALHPSYDARVYQAVAQVEWEQDKFEEAAQHLDVYLKGKIDRPEDRLSAERLYRNATFAAEAIKRPVPFAPEPLGATINTPADEYFPVQTADGLTLIFTRNEGGNEDFYLAQRNAIDSEVWEKAVPLEGVNTPQNEGAQAISPDGSWIVFTACNRQNDGSQGSCDLYWSQKKGEEWSKPVPFSNTINSSDWDSQPTISADGKTIIFSSKRPGGQGMNDLWETTRQSNGKWNTPRNLGNLINTPFAEALPFLHPDGNTLYFTSNGHPGFGEDDLFLSRKQPDGTWGKPENLGYPINTKAHDANLVVTLDGKTAYFSSKRPGGQGGIDIFKFELPEHLRPQPVTYARAIVTDAITGAPLVAKLVLTALATGEPFVTANTKKEGTFLVCLPAGRRYALQVSRKGYLFHSEHFDLDSSAHFLQPYQLNIALQPMPDSIAAPPPEAQQQPVVLRNVFFAVGSAQLLPESQTELDALVALLKENAVLRIQVNGHTDHVGNEANNQTLSEQRAQAVTQYLAQKGIASERLKAKGYGESHPVATNETPEGRAQNRRTEFVIW